MATNYQLSEFHRLQLKGVDWQTAAIDLNIVDEDGELEDLGSPDPGCKCDTCRKTTRDGDWWD